MTFEAVKLEARNFGRIILKNLFGEFKKDRKDFLKQLELERKDFCSKGYSKSKYNKYIKTYSEIMIIEAVKWGHEKIKNNEVLKGN